MGVKIVGTGSYLPDGVRTNHDVERLSRYNRTERKNLSLDEWARRYHGGDRRHVANTEQATSDLALGAAQRALGHAGVTGTDIDLILLATFTGDYQLPQTAGILQSKLSSRAKFLQIDAACSGFIDGLMVADALMSRYPYRRTLLVAADILSRLCDPADHVTQTVFGDGAGAVVLEPCMADEIGFTVFSTGSDGELGEYVFVPAGPRGQRRPGHAAGHQPDQLTPVAVDRPRRDLAGNGVVEAVAAGLDQHGRSSRER